MVWDLSRIGDEQVCALVMLAMLPLFVFRSVDEVDDAIALTTNVAASAVSASHPTCP